MNTVALDIYLARGHLRASVNMQHFSRVSDLFNNTPGQFLNVIINAVGDRPVESRASVIRLRDVLFVRPVEMQAPGGSDAEHRDRLAQRMVLELGGWRLVGDVHLVDSVRWIDFMTSMNDRFIPLTRSVVFAPNSGEAVETGFALVNGQRISALYEDD